uniref:Uncharacterized protein n=1 Tax=Cynoglossus semilaevis TaxID=244447 RepID=A0A3P8VC64_CYNSE
MMSVSWRTTLRGQSGRSSVPRGTRPWSHQCVSPSHLQTRRPWTRPSRRSVRTSG